MRDYVLAIGMALTGVEVEARSTAAPLITGGFTPDDDDRATICVVAELNRRDIIHINFRTIPPHTPTCMITTIFFDGEKAHPYSRSWVLADEHDKRVHLMGCLDDTDDNSSFIVEPDRKMTRHPGLSREFADVNLVRAGTMIEDLIWTGSVGETGRQLLAFHLYPPFACDKL
jgi:hypothetical protein